ncbi:MAG: PTS glucose transporter subunit IIA [Actinobacteria bacterium]|jgi:glucose-specific phosphotransferase system IIA component|nr:PTS glucose transporter subunit IIA [Actinomycetota bacterium]
MVAIASPFSGPVVALDDVADDVFSERVMGDGAAVRPQDPRVVAPITGVIEKLFSGGHGFAIETPDGVQVLVHVGLETVHLKGEGFEVVASEGDSVEAGDHIVSVDLDHMADKNIDMVSPVVVISGHDVEVVASGEVAAGDPLLEVGG